VKEVGESGTADIVAALREHGVRDVPMPATRVRVWQAMQDGGRPD
jgi:hypothetical protein